MSDDKVITATGLSEHVQALPNEISPERDLWPGIEKAISDLPQQPGELKKNNVQTWMKVAASFAPVALVLGMWFSQTGNNTGFDDSLNPITATFQVQKKILLQQVSSEPQVINNLEESLSELQRAEQSLIKALQSQPGDPALMKMLSQVYNRQLELIEKAHKPQTQTKYRQI